MRVAIQQPEHIPWVGFFNKMANCDLFIYLDNVQFKKRYFENRNKIQSGNGIQWLTVPVVSKGQYTQKICDVQIPKDQNWKRKYWKRLEYAYEKHPFWHDVKGIVLPCLEDSFEKLLDLNLAIISNLRNYLGIVTPTELASQKISSGLKGSDLILELCVEVNAHVYFSGPDGRSYLCGESFRKKQIEIEYHDFQHPVYSQGSKGFVSHLSVLDIIAHHGKESSSIVEMNYTGEFDVVPRL